MIEVAPDGDVIFAVGSEKYKVRVSSVVLSNASPVLATMFNVHFVEDTISWSAGEVRTEIPLPEDNYDAIVTMCRLLHCRCRPGEVIGAMASYHLAVAAEKYMVCGAISIATTLWIKNATPSASPPDLWKLAIAAYLMWDAGNFKTISKELIMKYGDSYSSLTYETLERDLAYEIALVLEESRNKAQDWLIRKALFHIRKSAFTTPPDCPRADTDDALVESLSRLYANDLRIKPLRQVMNEVQNAEESHYRCAIKSPTEKYSKPVQYDEIMKMSVEGLRDMVVGICLECYTDRGIVEIAEHDCSPA